MQKELADQELSLKKRARRRLVGAIALVLLMIILLPMLLKDRLASNPEDKITITLPNDANATAAPVVQTEVLPPVPTEFDSNIVPAEPSPATPNVAQASDSSLPEKLGKMPDEAVDSEASAKPAIDKPAQSLKDSPVNDATETTAEKAHKFYVQIGVFSDAGNVKQLQVKLTDLGYKSQTEKISTPKGEKIRLKTQIFADRNEAAIALVNIKEAGLTGMVVSQ